MRILHVLAPSEFGGLEEVVLRLAGGLHDRGHDVLVAPVFTGEPTRHPFLEALRDRRVPTEAVVLPSRAYRDEISRIRKIASSFRPDIVQTHGYRANVLHGWANRRIGMPTIGTLHGFSGGSLKNRFYEWVQIRSLRAFDAVVPVSHPMVQTLRGSGLGASAIRVIPNAWESRLTNEGPETARASLGVPAGHFHVGWIGRLSAEKGPDTFLAALSLLEGSHMTASIIGDGPMRGALEARANRILQPQVNVKGFIRDAGRLVPGFDVLVISSRSEGTPMVLFEAMAASVPVIATSVGGIPDVVDDRTALLVPPENPRALADALTTVQRDRPSAIGRAAEARRRVDEDFAAGPWVGRYEELYQDVLAGKCKG